MAMDKMEAHLRQQLSAMMDGELASDEARFLFRRLQHDQDLAGCWERWQVGSALLRGHGGVLMPAGFPQRVARALAEDSAQAIRAELPVAASAGAHPRRWAWWGGGAALAASLALLTVVPRPASGPAPAAPESTRVAAIQTAMPPATPVPQPAATPGRHSPAAPPATAGFATVLAVADVPRRVAARRRRAAAPDAGRVQAPQPAVEIAAASPRVAAVETQPLPLPASRGNPFVRTAEPVSRPWPRAVLPGAESGAFTASFSTGETASFYPFTPRNVTVPEAQTPAGSE